MSMPTTVSDEPPPFPNVLLLNALEHELIHRYHKVQWTHCKGMQDGLPYEKLSKYLACTYQMEHFNIFLVALTFEDWDLAF